MKVIYDLWRILTTFDIEVEDLQVAIARTFERRMTQLDKAPAFLTEAFCGDEAKQRQWRAFLNRSELEAPSLQDTCQVVTRALQPVPLGART